MPHEPSDAELSARAKLGDRAAVEALVVRHEAMAVSIGAKTGYGGEDLDDIVQEGRIGIANAAVKWDAANGSKFSTYAFMAVSNQVRKAVALIQARQRGQVDSDLTKIAVPEAMDGDRFAEVMELFTPLERGLVSAMYGLEGNEVGLTTTAKRFGLTGPQVREILISAFLRVRKQMPQDDEDE